MRIQFHIWIRIHVELDADKGRIWIRTRTMRIRNTDIFNTRGIVPKDKQ